MNWRIIHSILLGVSLAFSISLWLQLKKQPLQIGNSYATAVAKAAPAVVNIYTTTKTRQNQNENYLQNYIFGKRNSHERIQNSLGSGIIISPHGHIVTSLHIVDKAQDILVLLTDGREAKAQLVGRDEFYDIAVLLAEGLEDLPQIEFGDPHNLYVGDSVLAIGNPFGLGQSVSQGIISGLSRRLISNQDRDFIQTDAAINPGNSGGALINSSGELIGLNSRIVDNNGYSIGIGFAIPIDTVNNVLEQIIKYGKVLRPWFGFYAQFIYDPEYGQVLYINSVNSKSPAAQAGLSPGDIVLAIDNKALGSPKNIQEQLLTAPIGSSFKFTILRHHYVIEKFVTSIGIEDNS